jgi:hypothetical protein
MQYILDLIGSNMVAGVIILMILQLNMTMMNEGIQNSYEGVSQENMAVMSSIIENDFYKIGFHAKPPFFYEADSNRIGFYGDIDTNNTKGSIETVRYYTVKDDVQEDATRTFYKLFRLVNTTTGEGTSLGFTTFNLTYFDSTGTELKATPLNAADRNKIVSIKIKMKLESPIVFTDDTTRKAAASYWEKFISPKNLRRLK